MLKLTFPVAGCLVVTSLVAVLMAAPPKSKSATQKTTLAVAVAALPPIAISPNAPFIVPPPQAFHPPFDWFSWETFIALNWPAAIDSTTGLPIRGQANASGQLGDAGPRVWETYKEDWETFGNGSQSPQPTPWSSWEVNGGMNPCPSNASLGKRKVIVMTTKMDSVFPHFNQAKAGPLIDQNQKIVRYEIRLNQSEYESILNNQWYLQENLNSPIQFTASTEGAYGAMEVKAAWRELVKDKDDFSRYYAVAATVVDPGDPPTCRDTTLGMIGLHIVVKTAPFTEWVWATFEQEDNVPDSGITPGVHYSLNNGSTIPDSSQNGFNYPPNGADAQTKGPAPLPADQPLPSNLTPVQVTRFTKIDPNIASMNSQFHAKLGGTVWVHYNLVADQWPTNPGTFKPTGGAYPKDSGVPFPNDHVANTSAETYFQNVPPTKIFGNSCMQCHFQVAFTDFSWTVNDEAYPPLSTQSVAMLTAKSVSPAAKTAATHRVNAFKSLQAGMRVRFASPTEPKPPPKKKP
jgi:hypothetical protein